MQKIRFSPDVPMDLALLELEGRPVKGFRGPELQFRTIDDRMFYLSPADAAMVTARIRELGIQRGERMLLCQEVSYEGGQRSMKWQVHRITVPVGQQGNGAFVVPAQPGAGTLQNGAAKASAAEEPAQQHFAWAKHLLSETQALTDVYAAAIKYARERADQVSPADVLTIMLTALQLSKERPDVA